MFFPTTDIADSTVSTHGATRVMPTMSKMVLKFSDNPVIQTFVPAARASYNRRVSSAMPVPLTAE